MGAPVAYATQCLLPIRSAYALHISEHTVTEPRVYGALCALWRSAGGWWGEGTW